MKIDSYEEGFQILPEENLSSEAIEEYQPTPVVMEYGEQAINDKHQIFRKIICLLIYAAAFLTPLWFLPWTADILEFNKQTLLIFIASAGFVLYLVDVVISGVIRYKPSVFYLPIFGIVAANLVSVIFSVNKTTSLFGIGENRNAAFVTLISLVVLFLLAVNVIEDKGKILKKIIVASISLALIFGVLQLFGASLFNNPVLAARSFNSIGSINSLGILAALFLALFVTAGFFEKRNQKNKNELIPDILYKVLIYGGLVLAAFLILFINWWPVWMIVFISLLVLVAFDTLGSGKLAKKSKIKLFVMPMIIVGLGIFLMLINFNWVSLRSKLPIEIAPSHKISWKIALNSLLTKPLGYGVGNFSIVYDKFKPASIVNSVFYGVRFGDSASEAANMMADGGILVVLSFIAFLLFYWREMIAKMRAGFGGKMETGAIWTTSFSILAAFFLYPFNITMMLLLFLLLALLVLTSDYSQEKIINLEGNAQYSFIGSVIFMVGLVSVLVAGYFTIKNYTANIFLAKALKDNDRNRAIENFVKSANNNPSDARTYRLLSQTILTKLSEDLKNGPQKSENQETYNGKIQNEIASAVNIALRATNIQPQDSQNWANRGLVYENILTLVGGSDQAAINMYNESLTRNPVDPNAYLRIGNIHLSMADNLQKALRNSQGRSNVDLAAVRKQINENLIQAEESYKKAIAFYNNFGQALFNLAVVYDRQNKLPDAIKQFEKLRASNPKDPSIAFQTGLLYYRNNQKDKAFNAWQQAVLLFPNYSNARWYLSLVYEERGDLNSALRQVEEIEKFNTDNELVRQRLAQLRSGRRTIPPEKVLNKKPL